MTPQTLRALVDAYRSVTAEQLWENLAYFLERVVPAAESAGVKLAIHPDDPPWRDLRPAAHRHERRRARAARDASSTAQPTA